LGQDSYGVIGLAQLTDPSMKEYLPRIVSGFIGLVAFAVVWFGIAGRVNWWRGWGVLLAMVVYVGLLSWRLAKVNPELLLERNRPGGVVEAWDRVLIGIYSVFLVVLLSLAALDGGRYRWSRVPLGVQMSGWVLLILSGMAIWHVMMTNAYLSSWARLQEDRGQVVVTEGLYGIIRHPMYLGVMLAILGMPLALGSWWALIPAVLIAGLFAYRAYREDRMLRDGLPGYAEYAEAVKSGLLPGIW
jgi:protein-S-isoprenylcysteine O-methyltransferase Ste14